MRFHSCVVTGAVRLIGEKVDGAGARAGGEGQPVFGGDTVPALWNDSSVDGCGDGCPSVTGLSATRLCTLKRWRSLCEVRFTTTRKEREIQVSTEGGSGLRPGGSRPHSYPRCHSSPCRSREPRTSAPDCSSEQAAVCPQELSRRHRASRRVHGLLRARCRHRPRLVHLNVEAALQTLSVKGIPH